MFRIEIKFRASTGDTLMVHTINHIVDSKKECLRWITCIENAIAHSGDILISSEWEEFTDGKTSDSPLSEMS